MASGQRARGRVDGVARPVAPVDLGYVRVQGSRITEHDRRKENGASFQDACHVIDRSDGRCHVIDRHADRLGIALHGWRVGENRRST